LRPSLAPIALGLGLAVCLGLQGYGLRQLAELRASVERASSLAGLALTRPKAAPDPGRTELRLNTCDAPSAEELRSIVQQELAKSALHAPAAFGATEEPAVPSDPIENEKTFHQASRLVSEALRARVWGERDAAELRELKMKLTPEQIQSLRAQLIPAINRQELQVDVMPPF
jgi:hypothetical protein